MDHSLPGSSIHGISQVRILEWVAISFSRGFSWPRDQIWVSCFGRWILYRWATREALYPGIKTTVSACISVGQCLYLKVSSFSERLLPWWASQVAVVVKNPPTNAGEVRHRFLLQYFALRIPWTEDPGGLQSIGSQSVGHDWSDLAHTHIFLIPTMWVTQWMEIFSKFLLGYNLSLFLPHGLCYFSHYESQSWNKFIY